MISKYKILLAIIPFVLIILVGFFLNAFDPKGSLYKFLEFISEKDLQVWLDKAGMEKTSKSMYQIIRIIFSTLTGIMLGYTINNLVIKQTLFYTIVLSIIIAVLIYMLLYFYLKLMVRNRIIQLNIELPYMIKNVAYLAYIYPIFNALEKSLDYVPPVFEYDMKKLVQDIYDKPNSFEPYQTFIDRYDGKLKNLDMYFKSIYRMATSMGENDKKILDNLNEQISNEVDIARHEKNKKINNKISRLAFIPVILMTAMLLILMAGLSLTAL